ncbi:hypothetical protein G4G28_23195 [Massilia sp. Dwa41.01b]|nr:hypothetical protein [Massilia sp. Dwa41.01b]QNA90690.1 hypothetical protein G4G28_23195 [Massilia sp. Dwa41.01b]
MAAVQRPRRPHAPPSDALWLPLALCRYLRAGGDAAVLDESVPYLEGRLLEPGEDACVDLPGQADEAGSLYEHCVRAIRRSLQVGSHGLPLIGSGDWGGLLGRVGSGERGESVWLAFFLVEVLGGFAGLAERRGDFGFAITCRAAVLALQARIEEYGWDGAWYRRAYFADGTPLGSAESAAWRIDGLTQAWATLSGAAEPERAAQALAALDTQLVRRDQGLVRAFDPPFDADGRDPGRILAFPPGSSENGGEDTQVALWAAMAFARAGQGERAGNCCTC